jgi:periplasmic protein TonB
MTLTIKDSPEATGPSKPGSSGQSPQNKPGQSARSNPVCLEVPVLVRSLPAGENNNASGSASPIREEGRSVIVFENGGVLRLANPLPTGQTVILSNQHGRDVVCRVIGGRKLPSVKGYIEVEFIEPVNDFWQIHQSPEPPRVTLPAALKSPVEAAPEPPAGPPARPLPVELAPAPAATSRPVVPTKAPDSPSSGAPTFEDIARLVPMPPSGEPQSEKNEPAARPSGGHNKDAPARSSIETPNLNFANIYAPPISESAVEKTAASPSGRPVTSPIRQQPLSIDFTGQTAHVSVPSSFAASSGSGKSRGRMPLLLGGAALVLAGLGAGYFFMHRGSEPGPTPTLVAVNPPSALPAEAIGQPDTASAAQPAIEQALPQTEQPVAVIPSAHADVTEATPAVSRNARPRLDPVEAKPPERAAPRRPAIPDLKLSSPARPVRNPANVSDGSSLASVEMTSAPAPIAASPGTFGARTDVPPAPPPSASAAISAPAPAKSSQEAKLVSSTRPVYPAMARSSNIQGRVVVSASLDANGTVVAVKALSGPMPLRQAAVDAVKRWKYSPAQIDGKPAASQVTIDLDFRLN